MFSSQPHESLLPFPAVPEALKHRHSIAELALRPYGIYERDLSVDFKAPRPFLVTEILDCCTRDTRGQSVGREFFWELTVGTRIECLLQLVAGDGRSEISLALRCPNDRCGGELEIELTATEISELQQQAADEVIAVNEGRVSLRRPTGNDQLTWLGQGLASEADALKQMISTLIVEGSDRSVFEKGFLDQINHAMDEHDPLVNFSVQVQCPDCGREHMCEIDLEELSLNRLRQAQFDLLATVHRLARHYHWSEEEIFKVPYWRRHHYLNLVEREKER